MRPNAIRCISEELLGRTCHHVPIKKSQCFISFSALSFQNSACRLMEPSIQLQAKVAPCNQLLDSTMGYCAGNPELSRHIHPCNPCPANHFQITFNFILTSTVLLC